MSSIGTRLYAQRYSNDESSNTQHVTVSAGTRSCVNGSVHELLQQRITAAYVWEFTEITLYHEYLCSLIQSDKTELHLCKAHNTFGQLAYVFQFLDTVKEKY